MNPAELFTPDTLRPDGFHDVPPALLARNHRAARLIDVREPHEYDGELGRVAGAESVPLAMLPVAAASWDRAAPVVLICRSGNRSARAAALLLQMRFARVAHLAGGMLAWNASALPVERAPQQNTPTATAAEGPRTAQENSNPWSSPSRSRS